jgi:ferric-dicitrate binding protein FerR (iron transport regulator)
MPVSGLFRSGDAENFALALTTTHALEAVEQGRDIEIRGR